MKTYTYQSVTRPVEIEIDDAWAELLETMDATDLLAERKHVRADHKYAPGKPFSLDSLCDGGRWFEDRSFDIDALELLIDLGSALKTLTDRQRRYFVLSRWKGYSFTEIARLESKDSSTIQRLVEVAEKKIRKYCGPLYSF
jgi:RNA polymerase sigma factor (sigma-70 family)